MSSVIIAAGIHSEIMEHFSLTQEVNKVQNKSLGGLSVAGMYVYVCVYTSACRERRLSVMLCSMLAFNKMNKVDEVKSNKKYLHEFQYPCCLMLCKRANNGPVGSRGRDDG